MALQDRRVGCIQLGAPHLAAYLLLGPKLVPALFALERCIVTKVRISKVGSELVLEQASARHDSVAVSLFRLRM